MSSFTVETETARALFVTVREDALVLDLRDVRSVSVPLDWYPRLVHATPVERAKWQLIGDGEGIHWPDLDEDISVLGLLSGRRSGESDVSLGAWLDSRKPRA